MNEVTKNGHFGEIAILSNTPRSASAKAKTRATLLILDKLEYMHALTGQEINLPTYTFNTVKEGMYVHLCMYF